MSACPLPEVVKSVKPSKEAKFAVEEIRFQVDDTGALWEILTKSVYTNEFDYIRELLQNAIDATLLKIYSDDSENMRHKSPRSWSCNDKVMIAYSQKEGMLWVEDYGVGMNENDLSNYLFKTANSGHKYMKKREFMFPAIAKFGIGFVACLTKANKIQILTRTQTDNGISAEIESKSTIAFVEKNIQRDWQGTTVILNVKEQYSFDELKDYIFNYFICPSVEIDLINVDTLSQYSKDRVLFNRSASILQIVEQTEEQREYKLNYLIPDEKFLTKITDILSSDEEPNDVLDRIRCMLNCTLYETDIIKRITSVINDATEEKDEHVSKIRKEVSRLKKIINKKMSMYPEFSFPIYRKQIAEIVDYNQLIVELNDKFDIEKIYNNEFNSSHKGIIFIPTNIVDYDLGIEWHSINIFMFNDGKVVKNMVKVAADTDDGLLFRDKVISLDEIADADYEMHVIEQDEENEDYYEHIIKGEYDDVDVNYSSSYDVLLLKNNDFYEIFCIQGDQIEEAIENTDFMKEYKLFNNIAVPEGYQGEKFVFGESRLYQDGILLDFNPQCIVPIGVGHVIANLTAEARFELNVSRHELNNSREILSRWHKHVGSVIQKKVAENCIQVLRKNNLDYTVDDLLSPDVEETFAKENLLNMKNILVELLANP